MRQEGTECQAKVLGPGGAGQRVSRGGTRLCPEVPWGKRAEVEGREEARGSPERRLSTQRLRTWGVSPEIRGKQSGRDSGQDRCVTGAGRSLSGHRGLAQTMTMAGDTSCAVPRRASHSEIRGKAPQHLGEGSPAQNPGARPPRALTAFSSKRASGVPLGR